MNEIAVILAVFGGIVVFASGLALSSLGKKGQPSKAELFELLLLGGLASFFVDFGRACTRAVRDRSSTEFRLLILFLAGLATLVSGFVMF